MNAPNDPSVIGGWLADHDVDFCNRPLRHQDLLIRGGRYEVIFANAEKDELSRGFRGSSAEYYRRPSNQVGFDPSQKCAIRFKFWLQECAWVGGRGDVDRTDPTEG